jgi:hypothetical protein
MAKTSKTASKTKGALTDAAAWTLAQSALIDDDPAGFLFSQIDLAHFDLPYEFFLESDA